MPSSTARALELLETLQSSGTRTVGELAERLGVDERTVRRHVERLRELGVPVESVRGRHGGYRVAAGFRMPPLMLTEREATAALVALTAARGAASDSVVSADATDAGAETGDAAALATAAAKLRRSLPATLAERADALLAVATIGGAEASGRPPGDGPRQVDPAVLLTAADGIRERRPLALVHDAGGRVTRRTLQPWDLVSYRGRWYLAGLDSASGERRAFRLDRIRSLRALAGTFPAPPPHDALADLVAGFAGADYRWTVRLRIRSTREHLARHLPPSVATVEGPDDSTDDDTARMPWLAVTVRAESLDWLPAVLLALDRPVEILEPEELRAATRDAAERLLRIAGG